MLDLRAFETTGWDDAQLRAVDGGVEAPLGDDGILFLAGHTLVSVEQLDVLWCDPNASGRPW